MILIRNLILFIFFFLPLTLIFGLACNYFVGPLEPTRWAYEVQQYYLRGFLLFVPSILAVPVLHFLYAGRARNVAAKKVRRLAVVVTPIALLVVHLVIFGIAYWSPPLVVLFVIPGALYGASFRIVQPGT